MGNTIGPISSRQPMTWMEWTQAKINFLEDPTKANEPYPDGLFAPEDEERIARVGRTKHAAYLRLIRTGDSP